MWESIAEVIKATWSYLKLYTILNEYEAGVVYYKGAYRRDMVTGYNWKSWDRFPWHEIFLSTSIQDDIKELNVQTITNTHGEHIVVKPVVNCHVKNVRKYYREVLSDNDSNVDEIVASLIIEHFKNSKYKDIIAGKLDEEILEEARKSCTVYGVRVKKISYSTLAKMRNYRLITDQIDV